MDGSAYYINKAGVLCCTNNNKNIDVVVNGLYAPNWSLGKLETYVLRWGKYEPIRPIKKAVIR